METTNPHRTQSQQQGINAVSSVFGAIHLVFDILATGTAMAEASIIRKIDPQTKETINELVDIRRAKSMVTRQSVIAKIKAKEAEIKSKMQPSTPATTI